MEDDRKPTKANGGVATATVPDKDAAQASGEAPAHARGAAEGSSSKAASAEAPPGRQSTKASPSGESAATRTEAPAGRQGQAPKPKAPSDPLTDFLGSRQGKALQREVVRGVFGMLKKRL